MQSGQKPLLIYGAYGYTGRLVVERAYNLGLNVILAGRDTDRLAKMSEQVKMPFRAFPLTDPDAMEKELQGVSCVVHLAGPFAITSAPMLTACLEAGTDYVDVTGEIEVFESIWARKEEIQRAGISVVPGAGFDVVPTDCMARYVSEQLPHADSLVIALKGLNNVSQGTLRTAIRQISNPVLVREGGHISTLQDTSVRQIDFGQGMEPCLPVPWGDISTAFYSTGIGNIAVYFRQTGAARMFLRIGKLFKSLLTSHAGQKLLQSVIHKLPPGPTEQQRKGQVCTIVATASDLSGGKFSARCTTEDAYDFAAYTALDIAIRLQNSETPLGLCTPSEAFGADYILSVPGTSRSPTMQSI